MSQLQIISNTMGVFRLNVLAFSSPIFGSISGAQTRTMKQWYPIKANQPEIQFDVQFFGERDYEAFQDLVRKSQEASLTVPQPMIRLNWPERNINNWSGMITEFQSGGMRFNIAPRAKFTVFLFDSYVSKYNQMSQLASAGAKFADAFPIMLRGFTNLLNPFGLNLPSLAHQNQNSKNASANAAPFPTQTLLPNIGQEQQQ